MLFGLLGCLKRWLKHFFGDVGCQDGQQDGQDGQHEGQDGRKEAKMGVQRNSIDATWGC